jgi:hypothetical protein
MEAALPSLPSVVHGHQQLTSMIKALLYVEWELNAAIVSSFSLDLQDLLRALGSLLANASHD